MRLKPKYILTLLIALLTGITLFLGIKIPPKKLKATDLPAIHSISPMRGDTIKLTSEEIAYWESLVFEIELERTPGATPDFLGKIIGQKNFNVIYNWGSDIIWFSFVSEIRYGILNEPSPGGWTKPLYQTQANDSLKKLLRIYEQTYRSSTEH